MSAFEAVIGLEIHVQLRTRTKMFCRCPNRFGDPPNANVCAVCLAHPGMLPVANGEAVRQALRVGLALGCRIPERSKFDRKNYFYPDSPKAYQISQYDEPLCAEGAFRVPGEDGGFVVGITRAHLEEDAAKTIHLGGDAGRIAGSDSSIVDFNRAGTPLLEIVTEPDIRSGEPAGRIETFASQRSVPFSMSQSDAPVATIVARSSVRKRRACSPERMSGSVTISSNGVPARLKSTIELSDPAILPASPPRWIVFAASSSRWARVIPTTKPPSSPGTRNAPSAHRGWSYWLIWYAFGLSG